MKRKRITTRWGFFRARDSMSLWSEGYVERPLSERSAAEA